MASSGAMINSSPHVESSRLSLEDGPSILNRLVWDTLGIEVGD